MTEFVNDRRGHDTRAYRTGPAGLVDTDLKGMSAEGIGDDDDHDPGMSPESLGVVRMVVKVVGIETPPEFEPRQPTDPLAS